MTPVAVRSTLLGLAAILMTACSLPAQPGEAPAAGADDEDARSAEFLKLATQAAGSYELAAGDGTPLDLQSEPLLRWSNPVIGEIYGGVFLWTNQGRPAAIAAIFKWYSPLTHTTHEFQSLSNDGLTARQEGDEVWTVTEPGVTLHPVSDAPAPAASAVQRLGQMRRIAQRFSASKTDRELVRRDLRLLTQPLYRYEVPGGGRPDGALFGFVEGTDPDEIVLLIEESADGRTWQYALARLNFEALDAALDGDDVWRVDKLPSHEVYSHRGPNTKFQFDAAPE